MQDSTAGDVVVARSRGRESRLQLVWWLLTLLGSLALLISPWLAWTNTSDGSMTISIDGFNALAADNWLPQPHSDATLFLGSDDGSEQSLPSLSRIPGTMGGTDANAKGGIFVLVPGATAMFISLWAFFGEIDRRRSMARLVFLLGGVTLFPLIGDLFATEHATSVLGTATVGKGIMIGLGGAFATMIGSALRLWSAGAPRAAYSGRKSSAAAQGEGG